jgi:N-acetylneuraminic acid mutarotase
LKKSNWTFVSLNLIAPKRFLMKLSHHILLLLIFSFEILSCYEPCCDTGDNTGNWAKRTNFHGDGRSEAVAFTIGNYSYLGTGWSGGNIRFGDFWKYDPAADKWEQVASMPQGTERSSAVGFSINGFGYCGTGYDGSKYLNDFYKFDPVANKWIKLNSSFPGVPRYEAVAFCINDFGYVGTGFDGTNGLNDFYSYDPSADTWTNIGFPGNKRYSAVAFTFNNQAFVVTGIDSGVMQTDFWMINPASDSAKWIQLRHISNYSSDAYDDGYTTIARSNAAAFVIGDKAYISTGEKNDTLVSYTWEYDFASDLWTGKTPFEGPNTTGAVGISANNRGFIATGRNGNIFTVGSNYLSEFQPNLIENPNDN